MIIMIAINIIIVKNIHISVIISWYMHVSKQE